MPLESPKDWYSRYMTLETRHYDVILPLLKDHPEALEELTKLYELHVSAEKKMRDRWQKNYEAALKVKKKNQKVRSPNTWYGRIIALSEETFQIVVPLVKEALDATPENRDILSTYRMITVNQQLHYTTNEEYMTLLKNHDIHVQIRHND